VEQLNSITLVGYWAEPESSWS